MTIFVASQTIWNFLFVWRRVTWNPNCLQLIIITYDLKSYNYEQIICIKNGAWSYN